MSRELPILFNTDMVRAILDGRKTVTRRVIKPQPQGCFKVNEEPLYIYDTDFRQGKILPPFRPGDILYVRETWCMYGKLDNNDHAIDGTEKFYYRADGDNPTPYNGFIVQYSGWDEYRETPVWRPSIHMPKAAARIWLKVADVRVERLQEITPDQCIKEGVEPEAQEVGNEFVRGIFSALWDSTIKKSDLARYGWDTNPWVWTVEFERCEKPKKVACI